MDQAERNGEQNFGDSQDFMPTRVFGRWARDVFVQDAERGEELVERDVMVSLGVQDFPPQEDAPESADSLTDEFWVLMTIDDAEFYLPASVADRLGAAMQRYAALEAGV